jgi:hypothetical protein
METPRRQGFWPFYLGFNEMGFWHFWCQKGNAPRKGNPPKNKGGRRFRATAVK